MDASVAKRCLKGQADALLRLRRIELNGDWLKFGNWFQRNNQGQPSKFERPRALAAEKSAITSSMTSLLRRHLNVNKMGPDHPHESRESPGRIQITGLN